MPGAGDVVRISQGTAVAGDFISSAGVACVDIDGLLQFRTDAGTRLNVGMLRGLER